MVRVELKVENLQLHHIAGALRHLLVQCDVRTEQHSTLNHLQHFEPNFECGGVDHVGLGLQCQQDVLANVENLVENGEWQAMILLENNSSRLGFFAGSTVWLKKDCVDAQVDLVEGYRLKVLEVSWNWVEHLEEACLDDVVVACVTVRLDHQDSHETKELWQLDIVPNRWCSYTHLALFNNLDRGQKFSNSLVKECLFKVVLSQIFLDDRLQCLLHIFANFVDLFFVFRLGCGQQGLPSALEVQVKNKVLVELFAEALVQLTEDRWL